MDKLIYRLAKFSSQKYDFSSKSGEFNKRKYR